MKVHPIELCERFSYLVRSTLGVSPLSARPSVVNDAKRIQ